jgi:hypothetical protein
MKRRAIERMVSSGGLMAATMLVIAGVLLAVASSTKSASPARLGTDKPGNR